MPLIFFTTADGGLYEADGIVGGTLLQAAQTAGIEGFWAECGGNCRCATCHCYVALPWVDKLSKPEDAEHQLLDYVAAERRPTSRLACQIKLTEDLDGLIVEIPLRQI